MQNLSFFNPFIFWRKSSKKITSEYSYPTGGVKLDFDQRSDFTNVPSYVKVDPEDDAKIKISKSSKFYERLINEAPSVPAEFERRGSKAPPWANEAQIKEGVEFVQKHFYSIFFAHIVSLFLIITVKPVQALILRTSPFHHIHPEDGAPSPSFLLTLKSLLKLRNIYMELDSDISGEEISGLRESFKTASQNFKKFIPPVSTELSLNKEEMLKFMKLRNNLDDNSSSNDKLRQVEKIKTTLNPVVALSQYDLAIIQFTFFSLPIVFPRSFGIRNWNHKEAQAYAHCWALIGYFLGLRDEFNIALSFNKESEKNWKKIATEMNTEVLQFSFTQTDALIYKLWTILTSNLKKVRLWILLVDLQGLLRFVSKSIFKIPPTQIRWTSKINFSYHRFLTWVGQWWAGRILLNAMMRGLLSFSNWYYVNRSARTRDNDLSVSKLSLTRNIRWSSKDDGIVFDVV